MAGRADVLERGADRRARQAVPRRLRGAIVGVGVAAVVLVGGQVDLLSAGRDPGPAAGGGAAVERGPRAVGRDGHYFLTARPGGPVRWLAAPTPLPPAAALLAVAGKRSAHGGTNQVLLAVQDGMLFRADMRQRRWLPLAPADRLVSAAYLPGRALVLRGSRMEEVDAASGRTTNPAPFPGYDGRPWRARGVLDAAGVGALVMTRDAADGSVELALAWPGGVTRVGRRPERETLGRVGAYLGVSGQWLLTLGRACPGPRCELQVLRMTAGGLMTRTVAAPVGWAFAEGPVGGRPPRMLVPVRSLRSGGDALAVVVDRPVPAVLVAGSSAVRQEAGLLSGPDGAVHMLRRTPGARDSVVAYDPVAAPGLVRVADLPTGTRLVCVCG
ncbi:MAG TPA: hypothetical protein VFV76_05675 [Actinomycetes bacterium]|nr:hypothetical protein [Actinomycetes bacterium]